MPGSGGTSAPVAASQPGEGGSGPRPGLLGTSSPTRRAASDMPTAGRLGSTIPPLTFNTWVPVDRSLTHRQYGRGDGDPTEHGSSRRPPIGERRSVWRDRPHPP